MKKKLISALAAAALVLNMAPTVPLSTMTAEAAGNARVMEKLGRGLVVIKNGRNMHLSWRLLGTESYDTSFNVYRDGYIIANVTDSTNYLDGRGDSESEYQIAPVVNGVEGEKCAVVKQWDSDTNYLEFEIDVPAGGTMLHDSEAYTYSINDMSAGDLDGDGEYELVVKFMPSNAGESGTGYTASVMLGAYELDGTPLWTDNGGNTLYIDLGLNIRANPHGPQFLVYDFNGDGVAEITTKTAQGTMDTQGKILLQSNSGADKYTLGTASSYSPADLYNRSTSSLSFVNSSGVILAGREYYTAFDGETGAFIDTVLFHSPRTFVYYDSATTACTTEIEYLWGDGWGNRVDRHSDTVAYLDGETPYAVEWRGYYHGRDHSLGRTGVGAYKLVGNDLQCAYTFDTVADVKAKYDAGTLSWDDIFGSVSNAKKQLITNNPDWNYCGNGNHNMVAADFDEDGLDEVASGSLCLQLKNGEFGVKWNYNRGHGDAFHLGRYTKDGPLLYFLVHEDGRGCSSETVNSTTTTTNDTTADTETTTTTETILSRPDNDTIIWEVVTTVTNSTGTTITTKNVTRKYSSSSISAVGRGFGMSVIDPTKDGAVSNGLVGEPEVLFFEDAGGDTGRGIMIKGTEESFLIHSSANTARTVTYNASTPDDTDDSDGAVSKNGFTFTKGGGVGINKNGGASYNSRIYWDGDVYEEALDGFTSGNDPEHAVMGNYNESKGSWDRITLDGTWTNNHTKNNVCLSADLIGDWREEFICRVADTTNKVRLYTTNYATDEKIYTLMHDSQYRSGVASEQAAYNQPPHVSWYMGAEMDMAADKPNITTPSNTISNASIFTPPQRSYDADTAASLVWQDNTLLSGTEYTGHVLDSAYNSGVYTLHTSVMSESNASFNLRDSNSNGLDGGSYAKMVTVISFTADNQIKFGNNSWSSGSYTPGRWYDIDVTIDFDNKTQDVTVKDAETGACVAWTTGMGFRQDTTNVKRISWVSNESGKSVYIRNCAIYTGDAPTKGTVSAKNTVRAGAELAVSTSFKTLAGTAPTTWTSGENIVYTLYKNNVYTPVDATITATENGVLFDRSIPVGDYILGVHDGVSAYLYTDVTVASSDPILVEDSDIVLEVNGMTFSRVSDTLYTDTALTQSVSKSDLGFDRKSSLLNVLAKISDSSDADPDYSVKSYKVTVSQNGNTLATVTPTTFDGNNGVCMSQFVGDIIAPGDYSVTVELEILQDGNTYTVSKSADVTVTKAADIEEFFYETAEGVRVTVFVK